MDVDDLLYCIDSDICACRPFYDCIRRFRLLRLRNLLSEYLGLQDWSVKCV